MQIYNFLIRQDYVPYFFWGVVEIFYFELIPMQHMN